MIQEWIYRRTAAKFRKSSRLLILWKRYSRNIMLIVLHVMHQLQYIVPGAKNFVCTIFLKNIIVVNILLCKNHVILIILLILIILIIRFTICFKYLYIYIYIYIIYIYLLLFIINMLIHYRKRQNNLS